MSRRHTHASHPDSFGLEFTAFCETYRDAYLRYALVRIEDQAEAKRCVDTVLDAVGMRWIAVLASACPAAQVWRELRSEARHRAIGAASRAGRFHAVLRDDQADILLLHRRLSLPVERAAGLMGLAGPDARALLRGAEREFGGLLDS
ncbi:hypothetical protein [Streptomyces sp. NPDC057623]|uniref:hypothetical protein n=1 Tax=Streptomyces sp. NPDC057623 TaxID=3346187 RepID=UPI0036876BC8